MTLIADRFSSNVTAAATTNQGKLKKKIYIYIVSQLYFSTFKTNMIDAKCSRVETVLQMGIQFIFWEYASKKFFLN